MDALKKTGYWITAVLAASLLFFVLGIYIGRTSSGNVLTEKKTAAEAVTEREEDLQPTGSLNLNTASAAELEKLPGIGEKLAQDIVRYREAVGGFTNLEQLREIEGIGDMTYQNLAPLVCIE